jgi:DNA processing protein
MTTFAEEDSAAIGLLASRWKGFHWEQLQQLLDPALSLAQIFSNDALRASAGAFRQHLLQRPELVRQAQQEIAAMQREWEVSTLPFGDPRYPLALRQSPCPPLVLFALGATQQLAEETRPVVAIVGSRRADIEACEFAEQLAFELTMAGVLVISGLALGIDGAAHRGAVRAAPPALSTLAVLGSGLKHIYPTSHRQLARRILDSGGVLLSQFEPGQQPYPANFLIRNRVIAGLSQLVVVTLAAERSGALATARYATQIGRDVGAVPGPARDARYQGCHELLRQGAALIRGAGDVVELLPPLTALTSREASAGSLSAASAHPLLAILKEAGPQHISYLQSKLGASADCELLMLELAGKIKRLPGNQVGLV